MSTRILLADDQRFVREGLRELIEKQPDMEVVAEAEGGRAAVRLAKELLPDVVVMDVSMPDLNGIEATRVIVAETSCVKVVALSMYSDRRFVASMLAAGASGYLLKDHAAEELARAIRIALTNQTYLGLGIAGTTTGDHGGQPADEGNCGRVAEGAPTFSVPEPMEQDVLRLLAEGMSTEEIASRCGVRAETVEKHRRRIVEKIGANDKGELSRQAEREGLIPPEN